MKKIYILNLLVLSFLALATELKAQDPHFSMYYMAPQTLNPALTGLFEENGRVGVNYRHQWAGATVPYKTFTAWGEASLFRNSLNGSMFGLGVLASSDVAGDGNYTNNGLNLSLAYHQSLDADNSSFLSFSGQAGFCQRSLDFTKLFFDSQYNGSSFDLGTASGEQGVGQMQHLFFNASAGMAWSYSPTENQSYHIGVAGYNLNQPNRGFLGTGLDFLPRKIILNAGAELPLSKWVGLMPQLVYMTQGPVNQLNLALMFKFKLSERKRTKKHQQAAQNFHVGLQNRFGDAFIGMIRYDVNQLTFAISCDLKFNKLAAATGATAAPEVAIQYRIGDNSKRRRLRCPSF